jgi:hypothetical protein
MECGSLTQVWQGFSAARISMKPGRLQQFRLVEITEFKLLHVLASTIVKSSASEAMSKSLKGWVGCPAAYL